MLVGGSVSERGSHTPARVVDPIMFKSVDHSHRSPLVKTPRNMSSNTSQVKVDDCAICYDAIQDSQVVKMLQPCNHYFHNDCIN